ncbi:PucR family transcriptional regulator ligand-binding domain-containing protein [Nocardioides panacisoli]|uniref:helix-turn-helix domain-containing protein n=1 Tax=Nocardioides panacisoli TaxID=627624 RepID=UPI001C6315B9|nr:PucR family transcriptional regulator ligand-binding domain-containing protein [Nocardioides panacisoli]QYJ02892.1 PucR family transcriptional regulator ligand-binding domain-containing protein [Nocardioides panacisoli]
MQIPLSEILALPSVRRGAPHVEHAGTGECWIRRVHSSEVFEMGPLLRGGELLLTTGLGLKGLSPTRLEAYVDALADAGLSALAVELGRTFAALPPPLVVAARRRDLVLLTFREVVPFEEVVEAFHDLVKEREFGDLRAGERIWQHLLDCVLAEQGLPELLRRIAALADGEAHLLANDGRVVAASTTTGRAAAPEPGGHHRSVELADTHWGSLVVTGARAEDLEAVLDRGVVAVRLELLRAGSAQEPAMLDSALLRDIVEDRVPSTEELHSRFEVAGLAVDAETAVVGLAVAGDRRTPKASLVAATRRVCRAHLGACVVGPVGDEVLALARAPRGGDAGLREQLASMCASLTVEETGGHGIVAVAGGEPATGLDGVTASLGQARSVATIARRLGLRAEPMLARDWGIYRLLAHLTGTPELTEFLREQVGPLLDNDAEHGTDLVRTLDTYLQQGLGKTETAKALGIRRQTLYNRLDRINQVLGRDAFDGHESRTALGLALHAWRLRTGVDPGRAHT